MTDDAPDPETDPDADDVAPDPEAALLALLESLEALTEVFERENDSLESGSTDVLAETVALKEERLVALEQARKACRSSQLRADADTQALIAERTGRLEREVARNVRLSQTVSKAVRYVSDIIVRAMERTTTPMTYGRQGETERPRELSASGLNAKV